MWRSVGESFGLVRLLWDTVLICINNVLEDGHLIDLFSK
jgi:hypothetical protein